MLRILLLALGPAFIAACFFLMYQRIEPFGREIIATAAEVDIGVGTGERGRAGRVAIAVHLSDW